MSRILHLSITFFSLAVMMLSLPELSHAQNITCGDMYTYNMCAEAGCPQGSMCKADGAWPILWNFRCEVDSRCSAPIQPPANTTGEICGTERSVNGYEGCFASDNTLISDTWSCAAVAHLCCKENQCPTLNDPSVGCGEITADNQCLIGGRKTSNYQRCGGTNACCSGQACPAVPRLTCGQPTEYFNQPCDCASGLNRIEGTNKFCCGWALDNGECKSADGSGGDSDPPGNGNSDGGGGFDDEVGGGGGGGGGGGFDDGDTSARDDGLNPFEGPTNATFKLLNPLKNSEYADELDSPGGIVSRLLVFAFPLAGLILFAMIVWGGFEMITSAASSKGTEAGKQRITAAIVGFMLLFVSYWIFQIVEEVFGIVVF